MSRLKDFCFDCAEPWPLAQWWAETLGYQVRPHSDEELEALGEGGPQSDPWIAVDPVDGIGPTFWFNRVPEPNLAKNRVHVDIYGDVDELIARGAKVLDRRERWTVMRDPEDNEFCVFPA